MLCPPPSIIIPRLVSILLMSNVFLIFYYTQGQYRLGSSLLAREKYQEAIKPFSKSLQLLLRDASSSESDKVDTLTQLLSAASNLAGTTETNQRLLVFSSVPQFVLCSKGDISFSANLRVQKLYWENPASTFIIKKSSFTFYIKLIHCLAT